MRKETADYFEALSNPTPANLCLRLREGDSLSDRLEAAVVIERFQEALINSPCPRPVYEAETNSVRSCLEVGACGCDNRELLEPSVNGTGENHE